MRQLRRAGFSLLTIAKAFETDRETVYYHVKSDGKGNLVDFVKAVLPHLPLSGPPLPRGYSLAWVESRRLRQNKGEDK
jgi:hypothetical protein